MIKNYFKTALRLFLRNKSFSLINIGGLSLSMAVCLLLIMIIKDANEYDKFHPNSHRVYRINTDMLRKNGDKNLYATSPYMVASALASNYTGIEDWTMFSTGLNKEIIANNRRFHFNVHFTNDDFFDLFGFTLKEGNAATALRQPYAIILTDELCTKLFPAGNAIGKAVKVDDVGLFEVTGVMNKFPGKTHFEFDAIASFSTIPSLEKDSVVSATIGNWNNFNHYNYIRLKTGVKPKQVETALDEIEKNNYQTPSDFNTKGYRFKLQSLNAITPGPVLSNNMGKGLSSGRLWIFSLLAFVIIISAEFNYTNLTVAKSMGRMKEIAMRKVVGSSRAHIFFQIVVESVFTSLIALGAAFILLQFLMSPFSSLDFIHSANISLKVDATVILLFIAFALILGIVAGLLPAGVLSRIEPLMLIQKLQNLKIFRHLGLRKSLLVIQFMISLIFINLVVVAYKQT
jgi:putative ABC transport system permease protein